MSALIEAINYAVVHHLGNTISNSWSSLEGFGNPAQFGRVNRILQMAAAQGIDVNFASGDAGRYTPEELVRYSFEALEAWARDNGWPRSTDQTAYEFARQLGAKFEPLAAPGRRLAELYSSAAYSAGRLPPASVEHLRSLWEAMADRPLAGLNS